jgi:hypothetical protein
MPSPPLPRHPRHREVKDSDVVVLAKNLLSEYGRSKSLSKAFATVAGSPILPGAARTLARKLMISRTLTPAEIATLRNGYLRELFSIGAFGMESGTNIEEALGLFVKRLEGELSLKNKLRVRMGSAQALTHLGMGVFFPLFSSISSVIFSGSLNLFGSETGVSSSFALLSAAYVPLILLLSASFAHPENPLSRNALSVAPYVAVAFCIMLFVPNILLSVL